MIDWSKPVETVEATPRPVRVLCTDRPNPHRPIVVMLDDGVVYAVSLGGRGNTSTLLDGFCRPIVVRNVPRIVLKKFWVNTFPVNLGYVPGVHRNRYDADRENECCRGSRIACTEIEVPVVVEDEPKTVKREGWVNVYPPNYFSPIASLGPAYPTREKADEAAKQKGTRLGCIHLVLEEPSHD